MRVVTKGGSDDTLFVNVVDDDRLTAVPNRVAVGVGVHAIWRRRWTAASAGCLAGKAGHGESLRQTQSRGSGSVLSASWPLKVLHQEPALPFLSSGTIAKIVAWQLRGIEANVSGGEMAA